MTKGEFGVWGVTVPGVDGKSVIPHDSKIKVMNLRGEDCLVGSNGVANFIR